MQLTIDDTIFLMYVFTALIILTIIILIWKKKDDIHAFFYSDRWSEVEMFEKDGTVSNWLQKKNKNLTFSFNKGTYDLFIKDEKNNQKKISNFRIGRLSKFYYIEGLREPIDPTEKKQSDGSPILHRERKKIELTELWEDNPTMIEDIWKTYGPLIQIGGLAIIIYLILTNTNNSEETKNLIFWIIIFGIK